MNARRAGLALGAAVSILAFAGATACGRRDPSRLLASGHVEATEVRISTEVAGRLLERPVEEGTAVSSGQVLARIDTTDLDLALRQAEAERDQAGAELRLRRAGSRPEDIAELEAQVLNIKVELEAAGRDLERMQSLLDRGSGTVKGRDDARTRRDAAAARLASVEASLARARAGFRREEIDAAGARLAASEARLAQLRENIDDATIRSPRDGVVTETIAEPGELLPAGAPVCVVTDLRHAWLTVYVGEPDLPRVRIGQAVRVRADDGQTREGRVTYIAPQAEFTPKNVQTRDERASLVFKVKIGLDNSDDLYKPGMPAEAWLDGAERAAAGDAAEARP